MKFLSVRDLRSQSAKIWKKLPEEKEMVITSNGRTNAQRLRRGGVGARSR